MFRNPDRYFKTERENKILTYQLRDVVPEDLNENTKKVFEKLFSKNRGSVNNSIRFCDRSEIPSAIRKSGIRILESSSHCVPIPF